jgi:signal transduction histidine kinase
MPAAEKSFPREPLMSPTPLDIPPAFLSPPVGPEDPPVTAEDLFRRLGGALAHQVNNALTGVIGYLELALSRAMPGSEVEKYLLSSFRFAWQGAATVRRILTFTHPPPRNSALTPTSLRQLLGELLNQPSSTLPPSVQLSFVGDDAGWVQGGASLWTPVLEALITNAVEAMPSGGSLSVRLLEKDGLCSVQIRDTGVGMSSQVQARLFEPFFTTKGADHLGQGLILCRETVQALGGSLQLHSAPAQGTTVTLTLPSLPYEPRLHEAHTDSSATDTPLAQTHFHCPVGQAC